MGAEECLRAWTVLNYFLSALSLLSFMLRGLDLCKPRFCLLAGSRSGLACTRARFPSGGGTALRLGCSSSSSSSSSFLWQKGAWFAVCPLLEEQATTAPLTERAARQKRLLKGPSAASVGPPLIYVFQTLFCFLSPTGGGCFLQLLHLYLSVTFLLFL